MNKTFIILLGAVFFYFLVIIWQDVKKIESLKALNERLALAQNYEKNEKAMLKKKIISLNNPEEIELLARRTLGMIKKGEQAFKIIDKD